MIILVSLIDDVIVLALVFGALWYFKVKISLWGMIVIGLVLGTYIFIRTWAVLPSIRRKKITGSEGMIGLMGEVVGSPKNGLIVRVSGEYWQAECLDGERIRTGEEVEIVGIERLKLEVRHKGR